MHERNLLRKSKGVHIHTHASITYRKCYTSGVEKSSVFIIRVHERVWLINLILQVETPNFLWYHSQEYLLHPFNTIFYINPLFICKYISYIISLQSTTQ